jgi:hypothetical protein
MQPLVVRSIVPIAGSVLDRRETLVGEAGVARGQAVRIFIA